MNAIIATTIQSEKQVNVMSIIYIEAKRLINNNVVENK